VLANKLGFPAALGSICRRVTERIQNSREVGLHLCSPPGWCLQPRQSQGHPPPPRSTAALECH